MGIAEDFVLIVVAGLLGGLLAHLLRLPLLVGYVAAGVVVGPNTAGPTVVEIHNIELLAEIGVALLLFSLGLEIAVRDLQPVRAVALIGGPIQIFATLGVTAWAATSALGMPVSEAIWFGAMISLSSTMVVLKTLSQARVTTTLASRVMIGLLVIQDLAVIPMMIVLPQLNNLENIWPRLGRAVGIAALVLAATVVVGKWLLPRLLKGILVWGSRELFLVSVVAVGVGVGFAAQMAGISFALGAFVAGIVLSESDFSHQALSDIIPLRDIFGLLFFVTVGMLFDPDYVVAHVALVAMVVIAIFAGKALITGGIARAFGYVNFAPWIVGLGLSQIGEFSFVLARSGRASGLLSPDTYNLALSATVLTMAFSPLVSSAAIPLGRALRRKISAVRASGVPETGFRDHVIVAGYGRSGRAVARAVRMANIPVVVVELNHNLFESAVATGIAAVWGDMTRPEVLAAAHVDSARMLVIAVPDQVSIQLAIRYARSVNPALRVVARAVREHHVSELRNIGVDDVVQPEFEGGVEMVRRALVQCGRDEDETGRLVARLREDLYGAS